MYRYMLNVSYIGKHFRGSQIQASPLNRKNADPLTVQGRLEMGLKILNPKYHPFVKGSSRTDAGVHALHSTVQVDLCTQNDRPYDPRSITRCLNKYFCEENIAIRVLKTYLIPDTFNCRGRAISRTYLYRFAVIKMEDYTNFILTHQPIEEHDRCYFFGAKEFDVASMKEAGKLFLGKHDFRTFMGKPHNQDIKITRRSMDRLEIVEANSLCCSDYSWPASTSCNTSCYQFYNVFITSKGFLYKQVRRTVAALIGVAQGKVTTKDIKFMLEIPSPKSWNPVLKTVPAYGLYLCEVAYDQRDLETFKDTLEDSK